MIRFRRYTGITQDHHSIVHACIVIKFIFPHWYENFPSYKKIVSREIKTVLQKIIFLIIYVRSLFAIAVFTPNEKEKKGK